MREKNLQIYKANGSVEHFSRKKLFASLKRSGLSRAECERITDKVAHEIAEGSKTRDIYKKALQLVKQKSPVAAAHYSLKRAIFELGPTGYHFETFVARYFEQLGYKTKTCQTLKGRLVNHEVDVVAKKNGKLTFVECKFHNRIGIKNDIKIALYVKARWDDLKDGPEGKDLESFFLASNTAFSLDALTYAKGTGLHLLGVNAPVERSFLDEIKFHQLYPITSLKRLNKHLKNILLSKNVILAREIPANLNLLLQAGMEEKEINQILDEILILKSRHA